MRVALLNSRKPRQIAPDAPWLRQTLRLGHAIAGQGHTLRTSIGSLPYEAALYGAAKGAGRMQVVTTEPDACARVASLVPAGFDCTTHISFEPLPGAGGAQGPRRDRAVIEAADLAIAVAVRAGGHMESLLYARWLDKQPVQVVDAAGRDPLTGGNRRLLERGVPGLDPIWYSIIDESRSPSNDAEPASAYPLQHWSKAPLPGPTLSHFTRACDGPWPGQSRRDYLEDLWRGGEHARRDGRAALRRIVAGGALRGSGRLIRGGYPVVSFTAVHPDRLSELHRYRPHLIRWDFEPYGLVFDRDWLKQFGAEPVRYLPQADFKRLAPEERPWFQKHDPPACDYTIEEEWRIAGDLCFSGAPADAVRIFLPDNQPL